MLEEQFSEYALKPYTISLPQGTGSGLFRARLTEVKDGAVLPIIAKLIEDGDVTIATSADRDVREQSYEELVEGADRASRVVRVQFASPTVIVCNGRPAPYPVFPALIDYYVRMWNGFSGMETEGTEDVVEHVEVKDFKISYASTALGAGFEGWIDCEMSLGRTEAEISLFNRLIDFAFYCGTGLHTDKGMGQTRRAKKQF